jgi:hypothetical protein
MKKAFFLILFSLFFTLTHAQSHKYQSVFIYTFTKYVIWPADYSQGDFEIMVLGETEIMPDLLEMAKAKKVDGTRTIKVTKIKSVSDIKKCHILFVSSSESKKINDILAKISNQPTLVVTDEPGLGAKGSNINFVLIDGKLKFELNQTALSKQSLKVSNELTRLAILI